MFSKIGSVVLFILNFLTLVYSMPYVPREDSSLTSRNLRILPIGASITWGYQPAHKEKGTNGYRAQLRSKLVAAGYNVDFVGTQHSGTMKDNENEGHSGYTISQIQNVMAKGLAMKPNVVLIHAGTNDLEPQKTKEDWANAPKKLGGLIDAILHAAPDAQVFVAKLIQAKNAQTAKNIKTFNAAVPGIVKQRVQKGHKVTVVDQSVVGTNELVDGLHPTDAGYAHMGDIWYEAIKKAA